MVTVVIVFSLFVSLFVFFLYDFDRYAYIMPLFLFQEESEVPDDETVNQMLARSEEEFELYQVFAQINIFFS